jgi:hypothetical protein
LRLAHTALAELVAEAARVALSHLAITAWKEEEVEAVTTRYYFISQPLFNI